jgi:MoxR-like ATPase
MCLRWLCQDNYAVKPHKNTKKARKAGVLASIYAILAELARGGSRGYNAIMSTEKFQEARSLLDACRQEMARRVVGQREMVDGLLTALVGNGHVLLEGVPGLAKTLAVKTLAQLTSLSFKRLQFTPDLLPADLTGTQIWDQANSSFSVRRGPIFANIVLADEINRAPAKVQSALLEAMEERQVTIGEESHKLPAPFFVLATQNPMEHEGTYPLPEAELDRFLLKLRVDYPTRDEEQRIILLSADADAQKAAVKPVLSQQDLAVLSAAAAEVRCDQKIVSYIVSLISATRPPRTDAKGARDDIYRYISFGASPRASLALFTCARVHAMFEGRDWVLPEDVKIMAPMVLRHRIVLSFEAEADAVQADTVVSRILSVVPIP